jgi:membrane protein implicated in regulation of membrane protease activity
LRQVIAVLVAIFLGAQVGLFVFGKAAKFFHARLLWKPLKAIDSLAGVALELGRVVVIVYLVLTTLLWSPWSPVKTQINESQGYAQLDQRLPSVITDLRERANELLNPRP